MDLHPYARAILPGQIAKRLCIHLAEVKPFDEEEREQFGMFLEMKAKQGTFYTSQLEAWRNWNNEYPPDLEWQSVYEPPLRWEAEIRATFNASAMPGNYTETLGQQ